MTVIDITEIKEEWINFIRNSDIFSVTVRGVTTAADTGTFAADSSYLINHTNTKNIRSVVVGGITLDYGSEYNMNLDYDDGGTIKCLVTFTSPQTGAYTITYDYGPDKIFPDFPREDLTLASFPRIGADIITSTSDLNDIDGTLLTTISLSTVVYAEKTQDINDYITAITTALNGNEKSFFYIGKYVRKLAVGPILKIPEEVSLDKVFQQNIDVQGILNFER